MGITLKMKKHSSGETFYEILSRKKTFTDDIEPVKDKFKRVLNVFDLTSLGVGCTLGSGVYVLAGAVAKTVAGPAVVLSFIVAAIVSSFSGVCYAEFAGRVPKAGSAYIYSYVAVGEFIAFVIGWTLFIESTIGAASVAKALSNYLDSLVGNPQKRFMKKHYPMHMEFLGEYPDVGAFLFVMFIALTLAWGVRKSSTFNNIFTTLNVLTVSTVIVSGCFFADFSNWSIPKSEIPPGVEGGKGGFAPFGWTGVIAGAARCFFGFIGFESIASTGEETKNPKKTIPLAIGLTLFIVTLAYSGVASVLTLMWPYYDQDSNAPLPVIYEKLGMPIIKYLVTCGAVFALLTSLLGSLFPIPRYLYSMSSDGLIFNFLSIVNERTNTPILSTIICGSFAGILSSIFNLEQLVEMSSIGTLVSYLIVCACVLILRYRDDGDVDQVLSETKENMIYRWFNLSKTKIPNSDTQYMSRVLIIAYNIAAFMFFVCMANIEYFGGVFQFLMTIIMFLSVVILLVSMLMLSRLPQAVEKLPFKVPLVPLVPCLSIILNLYLMMELGYKTWIRFGTGLGIGVLIYTFYGAQNSIEGVKIRTMKNAKVRKMSKIAY